MASLFSNFSPYSPFRYDPTQRTLPTISTSVYKTVLGLADKQTDVLNPIAGLDKTPDGKLSKTELLAFRQETRAQLEKVQLFKGLFSQFGGQFGAFFGQYFGAIEQKLTLRNQAAQIMSNNFDRFKADNGDALGVVDGITADSIQGVADTDGDSLNVSDWDVKPIYTVQGQPGTNNNWTFNLFDLLKNQSGTQNLLL